VRAYAYVRHACMPTYVRVSERTPAKYTSLHRKGNNDMIIRFSNICHVLKKKLNKFLIDRNVNLIINGISKVE